MNDADFSLEGIDETAIRRERAKARDLRKTRWWQQKIAKGVCHYCGRRISPSALTMDHLVPLSRGGRSSKANLVPTCKECNTKKRTLLPLEWEEYMARLEEEREESGR
ncbi:MAG: HNH endonuclease signature motif containing protein [Deltaproteobacteria bacterium]|jgi:5-methylcytosine-specific restriction protein A